MKFIGGFIFGVIGLLCLSAGVYLIYHVWQIDQGSQTVSETILNSWPYLLAFALVCILLYDISKHKG